MGSAGPPRRLETMRKPMRVRMVTMICVVSAVLAGLILWSLWRSPSRAGSGTVGIGFRGLTNAAQGREYAVFWLTNGTGMRVVCAQRQVEYATVDGLTTNSQPDLTGWLNYLSAQVLDPGQSATILVPPPPSEGPWRLRLGFQSKSGPGGVYDRLNDRIVNTFGRWDSFIHSRPRRFGDQERFSGDYFSAVSEEVVR